MLALRMRHALAVILSAIALAGCSTDPTSGPGAPSPPETAPYWVEEEAPRTSAPPVAVEPAPGEIDREPLPFDRAPAPVVPESSRLPTDPPEVQSEITPGDDASATTAPTQRSPEPRVYRSLSDFGIADERQVALTFDDGPGPETSDILRVLKRQEVPATFFVVGGIVDAAPEVVRRMEREGFSVQSHSYMHDDLSKMLDVPLEHDLRMASEAIMRAKRTEVAPTCMRPPWGSLRRDQFDNVAALGQQAVSWDVDPEDWAPGTAEEVAQSVVEQVKGGGSIILLHDGGGDRKRTVEALPIIIETLRAEEYTFVALPCP